jgi:hypothetical protein
MKWRGVLVALMIVSLVGVTTLAQGVNVCPAGNVKYEIGGGYEYNDGSGWVEASEDRACWGANEGYGVTGVCIYVGGPDNEERLINLGPGDGCWDNPEKYGISHVVLYTEAILEPTPTDTPVEPTPTIVEPTPTEVPPEPTPTDTPPEPKETEVPTPNGLPSTGGQPGPNRPLSLMVVILAGGVSLAFFVLRRRKT